uniref:protein MIGRI n=1 Tax=Snodgrassella alvi TaxID=1196083 RepID=UPI003F880970
MIGRLLRLFLFVMLLGVLLKYLLGRQQKQTLGYCVNCLALVLIVISSLILLIFVFKSILY